MEEGTTEWSEVERVEEPRYLYLGPADVINDETDEFKHNSSEHWTHFKGWTGSKVRNVVGTVNYAVRRKIS